MIVAALRTAVLVLVAVIAILAAAVALDRLLGSGLPPLPDTYREQ